jgi:hypothetical protein
LDAVRLRHLAIEVADELPIWIVEGTSVGRLFKQVLAQRTMALFLIWLITGIALSALHVVNIGNVAHIAGLLFGALQDPEARIVTLNGAGGLGKTR